MHRFVAAFMVAVLSSTADAQRETRARGTGADSATRLELERARDAVWKAWFAGDTSALGRLIPATLAAGSPSGWVGRTRALADGRQWAADGGRLLELRFDSTTIVLNDAVATVASRYTRVAIEPRTGDLTTVSGRVVEVFVFENGRWTNPFWYLY